MSNLWPTKKDILYNKFLSFSCYLESAKKKIDKGRYQDAKVQLDKAQEIANDGMRLLRTIISEKDLWQNSNE